MHGNHQELTACSLYIARDGLTIPAIHIRNLQAGTRGVRCRAILKLRCTETLNLRFAEVYSYGKSE
jgi:hypothetical protein